MATHKQVKRKGFEWYRILTKKQRKEYRKNSHTGGAFIFGSKRIHYNMNRVYTFENFIFSSFLFNRTRQGIKYWKSIINKHNNK